MSRDFLRVKYQLETLRMAKCHCGSLYYPGKRPADYLVAEGVDSFYMRIDQAEGIDSIILPLFLNKSFIERHVADIGCGMGFASDFLRFLGRNVHAYDPSPAALHSSRMMGIEICNTTADETSLSLPEGSLLFLSEVVEHVENPLEFLQVIKKIAGETSYAVISTPLADFVSALSAKEQVLTMIAPSQHLFLFSRKALVELTVLAGFSWASSFTLSDRLFVVCGPKELDVNLNFRRDHYVEYLEDRLTNPLVEETIRFRSFGYRLFKEHINAGNFIKAELLLGKLREIYLKFGLDLDNPESVVRKMQSRSSNGIASLPSELFPFNLGSIFSLVVTLRIAYNHDTVAAAPFAKAVLAIDTLYKRMFSQQTIFSGYDLEVQTLASRMRNEIKIHKIPVGRKWKLTSYLSDKKLRRLNRL